MEKVMNVKKNLKRALALAVTPFVFGASAYAEETVSLTVNGETIESEGYVSDGKIYVSLSDIAESFGATYSWDEETNSVNVEQDYDSVAVKTIADVNESVVTVVCAASFLYNNQAQYYDERYYSHGSGVVIGSDGYILTNNHVIDDDNTGISEHVSVIFEDGEFCEAKVLYADEDADLAVIKVDKTGLKAVPFADESKLALGQSVIAIGAPLLVGNRNTVTRGIISGIGIDIEEYYTYIKTDADINHGNSGGPLINLKGELVGINTIGLDNLYYAVSIDTIKYVLRNFEEYGKVVRPETDFTLAESWESQMYMPTSKGLSVIMSDNDDILVGDIVTAVNGYSVHKMVDYHEAIKKTYTGGDITFTILRDGVSQDIAVTPINQ